MESQQHRQYINDYELIEELGRGGFGQVYKAIDNKGGYIAIKRFISAKTNLVKIKKEFEVLKKLKHENLVVTYDLLQNARYKNSQGKIEECWAITFQYIQGGDLVDFINTGKFSDKVARTYFGQFLNALFYIHNEGYAHRDIKLENILLTKQYILKLVDFGLAKQLSEKDLSTQCGTQSYMAPEIYQNKYNGIKADLFATGIVLFNFYTDKRPFRSTKPTLNDPLYKLIKTKQWQKYWKQTEKYFGKNYFSDDFKDLFQRLVCHNPEERIQMEQIIAHPYMQGDICTHQQIIAQFNERKKKIELNKEKFIKKQKEEKKNKSIMEQSRGDEKQDRQFFKEYEKLIKDLKKLSILPIMTKESFCIQQEFGYAFTALKLFFDKFQLPIGDIDEQQLNSDVPMFTTTNFKISDNNMIVSFQSIETIENDDDEEQLIETVKILVEFGLNRQKKLAINIIKEQGNYLYYKKIVEAIKRNFLYCLI